MAALIALAAWAGLGCDPDMTNLTGPGSMHEAMVFPSETLVGGTVAVSLDSNVYPAAAMGGYPAPSHSNLRLFIADESVAGGVWLGPAETYAVRNVFTIAASRASEAHVDVARGAEVRMALFDVPPLDFGATGPPSPGTPYVTTVTPEIDGVTGWPAPLTIVGVGGLPTTFSVHSDAPTLLETLDHFRMQANHGPQTGTGFNSAASDWNIGAIEFDLEYTTFCFGGLKVSGNGEASDALATMSNAFPVVPYVSTRRVMIVDPNGFNVPQDALAPDQAGSGPIIQFSFNWETFGTNCGDILAATSAHTVIRNLLVTDPDGVILVDRRGSTPDDSASYFTLDVVPRDETL